VQVFGRRDVGELHRLTLEQAAIDAAGSRHKCGVGPLFDDLAAIEHQNASCPTPPSRASGFVL
jgi:hypothetical protein